MVSASYYLKSKNREKNVKFSCISLFIVFILSTLTPIVLKLLGIKPFVYWEWSISPIQFINNTIIDSTSGEKIEIQGYGLCALMILYYWIILITGIFSVLFVNRMCFCFVLHVKHKKMLENSRNFDNF